MKNSKQFGIFGIVMIAALVVVALGWNQPSPAQNLLAKGGKGMATFGSLLTKHGDKGMLLEIHMRVAEPHVDKFTTLAKFVEATEDFLIVKLQNGQDLQFITWDDVLWITARPN